MTTPGRTETPEERADRRWSELLQEVRVAQTGAQILLGFLLTIVFTQRFGTLGAFDRALYVVTVVLGTLSVAALISPVSFHRVFFGRHLKPRLVLAVNRMIAWGMVLLGLTVSSVLLLLLRVATNPVLAWGLTCAVTAWFAFCWLLLPRHVRRRGRSDAENPSVRTRHVPLGGDEGRPGD
jgi:hypothetical protein